MPKLGTIHFPFIQCRGACLMKWMVYVLPFMKWSRCVCEVEGIYFSVCGMEGVRTVSSELEKASLVKWSWHACLVQ